MHGERRNDGPVVKKRESVRGIGYLPLAVNVAVLFGYADLLLSSPTGATAVFLSDADVFACVAVVTLTWALLGVSITNTFPFSALFNRDTLVSLDLGGLRSLLVPVRGRKDAERDSMARISMLQTVALEFFRASLTGLGRRNPAWRA